MTAGGRTPPGQCQLAMIADPAQSAHRRVHKDDARDVTDHPVRGPMSHQAGGVDLALRECECQLARYS